MEWISVIEALARIRVHTRLTEPEADALLAGAIEHGQVQSRGVLPSLGLLDKPELDYIPILNPGQYYPGMHDERRYGSGKGDGEVNSSDVDDLIKRINRRPAAGRPTGRSYSAADMPLVQEMRLLIESKACMSTTAAAWAVQERAVGNSPDSKVKRLVRRYQATMGE